jgi:hypothetical protein
MAATEQTVEPMTAYRGARPAEFANQSSLGFMTTATNRQIDRHQLPPDNAYAGGIIRLAAVADGHHRLLRGQPHRGSPESITRLQENSVHAFQRPDADYVEADPLATALSGHAGSAAFGKIAGEHTRFTRSTATSRRASTATTRLHAPCRRAQHVNWLQWRDFTPGKHVRTRNLNFNQWAAWNFGGDRLYSGGNINSHWTWNNYYSVGGGFNVDAAPLRDRVTRGGPAVLGNPGLSGWYYANTDNRKPLSFYFNADHPATGNSCATVSVPGSTGAPPRR